MADEIELSNIARVFMIQRSENYDKLTQTMVVVLELQQQVEALKAELEDEKNKQGT